MFCDVCSIKSAIMLKNNTLILFFIIAIFATCNAQKEIDKILKVQEIKAATDVTLSEVSVLLEAQTELHPIAVLNWSAFPYKPAVGFRIAHANNQIWLKYYVTEENILAQTEEINGGVSGDSCVEFFFDPLANGNYYNFEFSCIGKPHLAYGPGRGKRRFVDPQLIQNELQITSTLGSKTFAEKTGGHSWEMTMIIPASMFIHDKGIKLKGLRTKANFFKCGDKTSIKHYLTWNPIVAEKPDFHRPEQFGTVVFE